MHLKLLLLLAISFVSMLMDIESGKINNKWLLTGWISGLLCQIYLAGIYGAMLFLLNSLGTVILMFPLFCLGMFGGGDLKLFSVLCGLLGWRRGIYCVFYSLLFGAVISVYIIFRKKIFRERGLHLIRYFQGWKVGKPPESYIREPAEKGVIHFTIPIFFSVLYGLGGFY